MSAVTTVPVVNLLIDGLPHAQRDAVLGLCQPTRLVFGTTLCEPDRPFSHAYFPLTGFISLVATVRGHEPLEMGMIGNEGALGATIALGINAAPLRGVVQGDGTALRIGTGPLRLALRRYPALLRALSRYLYVVMAQLAQTAACTRFHEIDARLARWLLMTHDRAHADHFYLTHEFLAAMLGVRRSGITVAAGILQQRGLIRYTRGEINILDRRGLEAVACECYDAVVADYAGRLG